ncbi:MAG: HEAT repeat domain-containing protein [Gemmatimonadales bacterium]
MRYNAVLFTLAAAGMPAFFGVQAFRGIDAPAVVVQAAAADGFRTVPPPSWLPDDPADSLYREARSALQRSEFSKAAQMFKQIRERYPRSEYVGDSFYWEAFSRYRMGGTDQLKTALDLLRAQQERFADTGTRSDAMTLEARIHGELARRGDENSAQWVADHARSTGAGYSGSGARRQGSSCGDDEDDIRIAALNGLLQMDADQAMPILKKVLARRDPGSECLRRKAVFLVSQKRSTETEDILLGLVRNDPDQDVREQAVFWLSQVATEKSVTALDSILRSSRDPEIQKKAVFALSQQSNPRASQILRDYALRNDAPAEIREQAIFWIGQHKSAENAAFLQRVFSQTTNPDTKAKVIFSLAQMGGTENSRWILGLALDGKQDMETRKQALFWAGQSGAPLEDIVGLYGKVTDNEMKEQIIFVLSQRKESAAIDKLIDIAKNDPNSELRKKALFWVGQSHDPRAAEVLQSILEQ